MFGAVVC